MILSRRASIASPFAGKGCPPLSSLGVARWYGRGSYAGNLGAVWPNDGVRKAVYGDTRATQIGVLEAPQTGLEPVTFRLTAECSTS